MKNIEFKMKAECADQTRRSKQDKIYYMDSYYIRYLFAREGYSYRKVERRHRAFLDEQKKQEDQKKSPILKRELLRKCCEFMSFEEEQERFGQEKTELIGPLPDMSERFVEGLCRFFQVEQEDVCFCVEKKKREAKNGEAEIKWGEKRRELRERCDEMVREAARLEELLIVVLKMCNIGYLSKIYEYLADFLRPQARRFWMDMEKQLTETRERLERLNFDPYLGYQAALYVTGIKTELGWDYPIKEEFVFQENEPISTDILFSLMKRQGIESCEKLAETLSSHEKKVYPAIIRDLMSGKKTGTPLKRKTAVRMGEVLHADWQEMKEENSCFWTEQGKTAVWEAAETRMKQVVSKLGPSKWRRFLHGNDANGGSEEAELFLAVKNIIRFSLCGYEPERSKELLNLLEEKVRETKEGGNKPETAADGLFNRCIGELREEDPATMRFAYRLLLNGMNLELFFQETFEGELGEPIRQSVEEAVRDFSEAGTYTEEEKKRLKRWELRKQRSEIWEKVLAGFRKSWLQNFRSSLNDNPWLLYDRVLTITWVNDEENEEPLVLEDAIEVRIQLPRELDELLEPGEITARLPYERGRELDEVISQNWSIICKEMDESFGQELEGWDAELYEEWSENVMFKSRKISYERWELYNINNKPLDQMIPNERYGSNYEMLAALGRASFEKSGNIAAAGNKDVCYEEGVHLCRIEAKLKEQQEALEC